MNLVATATAATTLATTLASTGADAARTTGMIIGAAVFLLAGVTLLVAMRFRATRKRASDSAGVSDSSDGSDGSDVTGSKNDSLNEAQ